MQKYILPKTINPLPVTCIYKNTVSYCLKSFEDKFMVETCTLLQ